MMSINMGEKKKNAASYLDSYHHRGFLYLKDEFVTLYRQPYAQGLIETLVPLALQYLVASFNKSWVMYYNLVVFWCVQIVLRHFKTDDYVEVESLGSLYSKLTSTLSCSVL